MADSSDPAPGTVLDGRFVIRRRLGTGNFGSVYLADQQVFDLTLRKVALKLFHRELVTIANAREQLNDAAVLMRLQEEEHHPEAARHLITVLDAGFLRDGAPQAFVAMEYVAGYRLPGGGKARTLHDMIRAYQPVPVELALRWMTQILRALAWMHTLDPPVLHCDLKADNILPDGPDTLKVADFGLAQLAFGSVGLQGGAGALTCQSPETLAGLEPTPASDVYSLGLLMHDIFAGRHPLADIGLTETADGDRDGYLRRQIEARRAGLPPLVEVEPPELADHPILSEIVGRCLRFHAYERYADAAMLLRDIEGYVSGGEVSVSRPIGRSPDGATDLERRLAEAEAFQRQDRPAEARDRAEDALARYPDAVAAHTCLGRIHLAAGRWRETLRLCAAAGNLPNLPVADRITVMELSGDAYEAGGQPALAGRMWERAAALRRGDR